VERRTSSVRRAALAGAALVLAATLAACGGRGPVGRGPAAIVDGHDITFDEVKNLSDAQGAFLQAATKSTTVDQTAVQAGLAAYHRSTPTSIGTGGASQALSELIQAKVFQSVLASSGEKVTEADRTQAKSDVESSLSQYGITVTKTIQPYIDSQVELQALFTAITRSVADPTAREKELRSVYEANKDAFDQVCIQQIVTADEASAQAAFTRIQAGEDFATVAAATPDQQAGLAAEGDEQSCLARTQLAGVFGDASTTAKTGDVLGPADGQGSWIIVRIWNTRQLTFDQARDQLESGVEDTSGDKVNQLVQDALEATDVWVAPQFGTWSGGAVVAPSDPTATTSTTVAVAADTADPAVQDPTATTAATATP
jgi:parvulin-like peptidyl-prolyl isomerase